VFKKIFCGMGIFENTFLVIYGMVECGEMVRLRIILQKLKEKGLRDDDGFTGIRQWYG